MMRRYLAVVAALLIVAGASAQKIDESLLRLLPKTHARAEVAPVTSETIDTAAVKQQINVSFNADGSVRRFSAIAMLKEGAACPDARLQQLGIKVRDKIGRMLILSVPAESLKALDAIDEVESVSADIESYLGEGAVAAVGESQFEIFLAVGCLIKTMHSMAAVFQHAGAVKAEIGKCSVFLEI